jgi:ATPase subunit of ABC transporter with duplicated ATPase domains
MMIEKPNVLLLDEPTNHLDLEGIEALVEGLLEYEGTLVFVSHDRWFVSKLATRVLDVRSEGLFDFKGTFDEYLAQAGEDHLDAEAIRLRAQKDKRAEKADAPTDLSGEERKRRQNRLKSLPQKRDQLLERIGALEERLRTIEAGYCEPGFFERTDSEAVAALRAEEADLKGSIERLTAEWERIEEELLQDDG